MADSLTDDNADVSNMESTFASEKSAEFKTPIVKNKKLGLKMVSSKKGDNPKKKSDLNISKLKSVKNKNFLNMSAQKLSLRANNRSLAQKLSKSQQDLRQVADELKDIRLQLQESRIELNHYKRVAGLKDENIEKEVTRRIQSHMAEMRQYVEDLSQKMIENSVIINNMNIKCLTFTRKSLDSSRAASLGDGSTFSKEKVPTQTSKDRRNQLSGMANKPNTSLKSSYLVNSNECAAPSLPSLSSLHHPGMDMSLIAEQSMVGEEEDEFQFMAQRLSSVSESTGDTPEAPVKEPISRLPQRVPRSQTSPPEVSKSGRKSSDGKLKPDHPDVKQRDSSLLQKQDSSHAKKIDKDTTVECDISSFGFGGNFADELVSGSPISSPKTKGKSRTVKNVPASAAPPKIVMSKAGNEQPREKKTVDTISKTNVTSSKSSSNKVTKSSQGVSVVKSSQNKVKMSVHKSNVNQSKPSGKAPAKSSGTSKPVKSSSDIHVDISDVKDPFKPTKVLLRSPVSAEATPEGPLPASKLDSKAFIAMLKENSGTVSSSVPEPSFPDEPTCYFTDADMDLTSVIGKLGLPSSNSASNWSSPNVNDIPEGSVAEPAETAVEVRNKIGVFTFSVPRKDKDGARKQPLVEKTSTARSKKKVAAQKTPDKDSHRTGSDRDMFNFGDRTPTVPLEKIVMTTATKTVYDLSMNESVMAQTTSLNTLREKTKKGKEDMRGDNGSDGKKSGIDDVYYVALKGCSDEKPSAPKRSRSKSTTRSRSKSRGRTVESDDDDWTPETEGRKSISRSRSKTRSKKDEADNEEVEVIENVKSTRSKSTTRSKSKSQQVVEASDDEVEEESTRTARSKHKADIKKESLGRQGRSRSRKRKAGDDDETRVEAEAQPLRSASNVDTEEEKKETLVNRMSRSRSRARSAVNNTETEGSESPKKSKSHDDENGDSKIIEVSPSKKSKLESESSTQKDSKMIENSSEQNVYYLPLKCSPDQTKPKGATRSRSRSQAAVEGDAKAMVDDSLNVKPVKRKTLTVLDSNQEDEQVHLKSRRKSRKQERSSRRDVTNIEDSAEDPFVCSQKKDAELKTSHKPIDREDGIICNSESNNEVDDVSVAFTFVTTSRGRKSRQAVVKQSVSERDVSLETEDIHTEIGSSVAGNKDSALQRDPVSNLETPVAESGMSLTAKKKKGRPAGKSVKKSKMLKNDLEMPHQTNNDRSVRRPLEDEDVNQSEESRADLKQSLSRSTKTPAAGTRKSTKSKTGNRTARKNKVPEPLDSTPCGELKKDQDKENDSAEDNLTQMKRRLNVLFAKSREKSAISPTKKSRESENSKHIEVSDTSRVSVDSHDLDDGSRNEERSKRRKKPVSYVQPSLHLKMRREDFQEAKAKAENARMSLAMKTQHSCSP